VGRAEVGASCGSLSVFSGARGGGLNGAICSGASAGVLLSVAFNAPAALVESRVPQFSQVAAPCGFIMPQMGQRTSVDGDNSAAQFLQNLLFGLFGVPQCGQ